MNDNARKQLIVLSRSATFSPALRDLDPRRNHSWNITFMNSTADMKDTHADAIVLDSAQYDTGGETFFTAQRARNAAVALLVIRDDSTPPQLHPVIPGIVPLPLDCDGEALLAMVDRAHMLAVALARPEVKAAVGELDRLPSVPKTYHALSKAAADPETSIADIARIVQSDPVMAVRILQLVNSAFFGRSKKTSSIPQAIGFLGLELLKSLVLSAHIFETLDTSKIQGFSLEHFQHYSILIARIAQRLLPEQGIAAEAFTAGIIHDIGQLILAVRKPDEYSRIITQSVETGEMLNDLEYQAFGVGHAEVGAYLLSTWGIPWKVVECVAFHHKPSVIATAGGECEVLAAVHAAVTLFGILRCGEAEEGLDTEFLVRSGVIAELPRWRQIVEYESEN